MGLDTTHNAWNGSCSSFNDWRRKLAKLIGLPSLYLMEGFYYDLSNVKDDGSYIYRYMKESNDKISDEEYDFNFKKFGNIPIKWEQLPQTSLYILLSHSDSDGDIKWEDCKDIADELTNLLPKLESEEGSDIFCSHFNRTKQFIDGLMLAYNLKENLEFR